MDILVYLIIAFCVAVLVAILVSRGRQIELDLAPQYDIRLKEIEKALKSSISYAGCKDLSCLSDTKFIQLK